MSPYSVRPDPEAESRREWAKTVHGLLDAGQYAEGVRVAYRSSFDDVVESFGLAVPASTTDREFLRGFLRPDMGPVGALLLALFELYEPVRFGTVSTGEPTAVTRLVDGIQHETVLGRLRHPLYQPRSPKSPSDAAGPPAAPAARSPR